jgi:hypothetical protein
MLETFGGAPALQNERRESLIKAMPEDPAGYRAENIVWFVIRPDDSRAARITNRWVAEHTAHERGTFGSLRVIELPREVNDAGAASGSTTIRDAAIGSR